MERRRGLITETNTLELGSEEDHRVSGARPQAA